MRQHADNIPSGGSNIVERDVKRMNTKKSELKKGESVARKSTVITLILTILKGVVGLISGSIVLIADAIHSFSDVISILAVWFGLRLSQKKPDERFTYGYYKAETLSSLIASLMVLLAGIEMMRESYHRLLNPTTLTLPSLALTVAIVSAVVSYYLMTYKRRVGIEINSSALLAEAENSKTDIYSSIIVFAGLFSSAMGYHAIEPFACGMISLLVLKVSLGLIRDNVLILMDACTEPELVDKVGEIIASMDGIRGVHAMRLRRSGPFRFGEAHVELEGMLSVDKAHDVTLEIEKKISENVSGIDSFLIHVEPSKSKEHRIAIPVLDDKGTDSKPALHFGKTPYFIFVNLKNDKIKDFEIKENPAANLDRRIGMTAAKFLADNKVNVLIVGEVGEGAYYALKDHFVGVYQLKGKTVGEVIENFIKDELARIEKK